MTLLALLFVGSALLLIAVAVPLSQWRIPPNSWYGFRVPKTLRDQTVWYEANAYAGRLLVGLGAVTLVAAHVTAPFFRGDTSVSIAAYALLNAAVLLIALAVIVFLSFHYLRTL